MKELLEKCKDCSVEELEKIVAETITGAGNYFRSFWPNLEVPRLYRARIHNNLDGNIRDGELKVFNTEAEFWNPPAKCIQELGRCNDIEQSLLYCSNSWETAIAEVRPVVGEYLSMAVYNLNQDGLGSRISPIGVQYLSQIESLTKNKMFEDYKVSNEPEILEIDAFLDELFHLEVDNNEKYKYKLSIAVTNCLMKNIQMGEALNSMHGIMYSSIVRNKQSYNLVLRPNHARTIYQLFQVQTFKVNEVVNGKYQLELKKNGYKMGPKLHALDYFEIYWETVPESKQNIVES